MVQANKKIMDSLITDTLKRIKEMYDLWKDKCDIAYIGFSGGKDSVVLLDLCHHVLPLSVPVVFSDTDMELPDTYHVWEEVQRQYPDRQFIKVKADIPALDNWYLFGPPSQTLRWCCSVHKSTPAILHLKNIVNNPLARTLAFIGIRGEESLRRSDYDDIGDGLKSQSQVNAMPILSWGTHELFLYLFNNNLLLNKAYRKGLPRVGCLLCPMSNERQVKMIKKMYPQKISCFTEAIKAMTSKEFSSKEDCDRFVLEGGWHARHSGASLKSVIAPPAIRKKGGVIFYSFDSVDKNSIYEWLKTLGNIQINEDGSYLLKRKNGEEIIISLGSDTHSNKMICDFKDKKPSITTLKWLRRVIHKSLGCVSCQACEAECPFGALKFKPKLSIDTSKCNHCMKCHSHQDGCIRYFSKRYAGGTTMNISGINKYMTFGLKQQWVSVLASEREDFRATIELGTRMVPAAITWFREAKLISDSASIRVTKLLDVAEQSGFDDLVFWDLIWINLINASPLIKWYGCNSSINEIISLQDLNDKLSTSVASDSVRKGALQSLCGTLKFSPLGMSASPIVRMDIKGKRVVSLKRMAHSVSPLVVLYSLYAIGQVANRSSFTLSEMMSCDFESPYISPLLAFGMPVDELKMQCIGLTSKYPEFISCSFTLGLDEIKIFPEKKAIDDIINLVLED